MIASRSAGREALQRAFVALRVLGADRLIERRRGRVGELIGNLGLTGPPIVVARDIANAIQDRLAQVGLQRTLMSKLEPVKLLDRGDDRVLDEIRGVLHAAGGIRQAAVRPAPQHRDQPDQQAVKRFPVALFDPVEQIDRRLR